MRLVCFQFVSKLEKSLPRYVYDALHGAVRASLWAKVVVAAVVIVCACHRYYDHDYCRTEYSYYNQAVHRRWEEGL